MKMFTKALPLVFLAAVASAPAVSAATPVEEESFSILLPDGFGKFSKKEQTVRAATGDIKQVTFVSTAPDGDAVIVTYGQMSGRILDPAATMKGGRDSLIASIKATPASEKEVEIDGKPGMTLTYTADGPRKI